MTKATIMKAASRKLHKAGFILKKHSPEILAAVGVVGVVASTVMACKATMKAGEILEEAKRDLDTIHERDERFGEESADKTVVKYPEDVKKKDIAIVYAQTGFKFVKLYGPSVALGVASIGCLIASNQILRKRNIALAAAYATVDKGFKEYRGRVVERFGKDMDRELRYDIKAKQIQETVVDENGNETVVEKTVNVATVGHSEYAKFFDECSSAWTKDAEANLIFLRQTQNYLNDMLQTRGHVFLNEVYDALGIQRTQVGQTVGWVYDPKNPDCANYIDFGIYDLYDEAKRLFVNGYERSILLDFNVDGVVWDLMG